MPVVRKRPGMTLGGAGAAGGEGGEPPQEQKPADTAAPAAPAEPASGAVVRKGARQKKKGPETGAQGVPVTVPAVETPEEKVARETAERKARRVPKIAEFIKAQTTPKEKAALFDTAETNPQIPTHLTIPDADQAFWADAVRAWKQAVDAAEQAAIDAVRAQAQPQGRAAAPPDVAHPAPQLPPTPDQAREYARNIDGVVSIIDTKLSKEEKRDLFRKIADNLLGRGDIPRIPDSLPPELIPFWPAGAYEWANRLNEKLSALNELGLTRLEDIAHRAPGTSPAPRTPDRRAPPPSTGPSREEISSRLEAAREKYAEAFKKFEKFDLWWGKLRKGKREELRQAMEAARAAYEQAKASALAAGPEVADAEKVAARVRSELAERMALTGAKKEQYDKGMLRAFMRGWQWLGEKNLYNLFGRPGEERKGWKAAVGKAILRGANLRTAIGGALAATGVYAPLGATKLAIFGARGGAMALGAGIGTFEGMRGAYLESQKREGNVLASVFANRAEAETKLRGLSDKKTLGFKSPREKALENAVYLEVFKGKPNYKEELESRMSAFEWRAIADGQKLEGNASYKKLAGAYAELLQSEAQGRADTVTAYLADQHKAVEARAIAVRGKERKAMAWRRGFAALTGGLFGGAMSWVSYGNSVLTGRLHEGVPMEDILAEHKRRLGAAVEAPKPVAATVEAVDAAPETPKVMSPQEIAAGLSEKWGIEAPVIAKARETFGFLGDDEKVRELIEASAVKRGDGIESGLLRQLRLLETWKDDPKMMEWFTDHGYNPEKMTLDKFAGRLAHRIAMDTGYVTGDGKGRLIGTYWNAKIEAGEKVYRVLGEETGSDGKKHWGIVKSGNLEKLHVEREYKTPFYPQKAIAAEIPVAPSAPPAEVPAGARPPEALVSAPRASELGVPVVEKGFPPVPGEQAPVIPHLQIPDDMPSRARVSVEYAWQQYTAEEDAWRRFQALHPDDEYAEQFADAHMDEIRDKKVAFVKEVLQHKVPVRTVVNPARLHATGGWEGFTQRTSEDINWRYSDYLRDLADQKVIAARIAEFSATELPETGELTATHPVDVVLTQKGKALALLNEKGQTVQTPIPEGVAIEESAKPGSKWITVFSEDGIVAGELSWNPDTSQMEIAVSEDGGEVERMPVKEYFEEIAK